MARQRSFTHYYTVTTVSQTEPTTSQGELHFTGKAYYHGFELVKAQRAFWRACRQAQGDPRVFSVTVHRNTDTLLSFAPRPL
jgi:hypothetical protein